MINDMLWETRRQFKILLILENMIHIPSLINDIFLMQFLVSEKARNWELGSKFISGNGNRNEYKVILVVNEHLHHTSNG